MEQLPVRAESQSQPASMTTSARGFLIDTIKQPAQLVLLGAVLYMLKPLYPIAAIPALALTVGAVVALFRCRRHSSLRLALSIGLLLAALVWATIAPFVFTPSNSYVYQGRGPAFGWWLTRTIESPTEGGGDRHVLGLGKADPVRRVVYRWWFSGKFRDLELRDYPAEAFVKHVRMPLKHLHRVPEPPAAARVSLYHRAPMIGVRIGLGTALELTAYTSDRPVLAHTYSIPRGTPSWEDVPLSTDELEFHELQYLVLLTEALDAIGDGRAAESIPVLERAAAAASHRSEQARVRVLQAFVCGSLYDGNIGLVQALYYAREASDVVRQTGLDNADPDSLSPSELWTLSELRAVLGPVRWAGRYESLVHRIESATSEGANRYALPSVEDAYREGIVRAIDTFGLRPETERRGEGAIFDRVTAEVTGVRPEEVLHLIEESKRRLGGMRPGDDRNRDVIEAEQLRLCLLESAFLSRTMIVLGHDILTTLIRPSRSVGSAEVAELRLRFTELKIATDKARGVVSSAHADLLGLIDSTLALCAIALDAASEHSADPLSLRDESEFLVKSLIMDQSGFASTSPAAIEWTRSDFQRMFVRHVILSFLKTSALNPSRDPAGLEWLRSLAGVSPDADLDTALSGWVLRPTAFQNKEAAALPPFLPGMLCDDILAGKTPFAVAIQQGTGLTDSEIRELLRPGYRHGR